MKNNISYFLSQAQSVNKKTNTIFDEDGRSDVYRIRTGEYRRFSKEDKAITIGVANCFSVLIITENDYYFAHSNEDDITAILKITRDIYSELINDYKKIDTYKVFCVGGTTYTEKSYPQMKDDAELGKSIEKINVKTNNTKEILKGIFEGFKEENICFGFLEPDTCIDVGYNSEILLRLRENPPVIDIANEIIQILVDDYTK